MDYIYEILVPEVVCRLIQEDNNNITLEKAREIMVDSKAIEFGKYVHGDM